jgi:type IV secretion system protein VirB5
VNFPFRKPPRAYAAEAADTPFARAQQAWDRRMGSAVNAAHMWRTVSGGLAVLLALSIGAFTVIALQKRTYVHVVEVSPNGAVLSVQPVSDHYTPNDAQVSYFLGHFVRLVREIPTDGVVLRQNWFEAYRFLAPQAAQHLNELAREDDPFAQLGATARTAMITSVVQRSAHTWQVSWIEATHGADARGTQSFTGLFTVSFDSPRNADALMHNPLGLFITEFSTSPETPASSFSTPNVQP